MFPLPRPSKIRIGKLCKEENTKLFSNFHQQNVIKDADKGTACTNSVPTYLSFAFICY